MSDAATPASAPVAREGRELRVLTYDPQQPSFRYRIAPLLPHLQALGWHCTLDLLPEQRYGWRIWQRADALRGSTAVLLHKLRLQPWEMRWVARLNPRTVFDVDDAIWLRQPKWVGQGRPPSPARQRKFDGMCHQATLTMAGNARAGGDAVVAAGAIVIAAVANTLSKSAMAGLLGSAALRRRVIPVALAVAAVGAAAIVVG